MTDFRLGFGPMSYEIVVALGFYAYTNKKPIMIIASRNQVDHDSGYVMKTQELKHSIDMNKSPNLLLCRDHCGPYFLDSEKDLSERDAIEAAKKTIAKDIEVGFDLIHIDTSRCTNGYSVADELFKFALDLNPKIQFEFGTEENVGVAAGIEKYKNDVAFASQFPNMKFVVAQTGSLVSEDRQAGTFELEIVKDLVAFANEAGVGLKEHNADYLTAEQIQLRKAAGVHALNIAPQLGVLQTRVIKHLSKQYKLDREWDDFAQTVINSNKWSKWFVNNESIKVDVAGHYLYQHPTYKQLVARLQYHCDWRKVLQNELLDLVKLYEDNL